MQLARAGHDVAVNVRSDEGSARSVPADIVSLGARASAQVADVSEEAAAVMLERIAAPSARSVGWSAMPGPPEAPIEDLTRAERDETVGPVLTGTFLCCRPPSRP